MASDTFGIFLNGSYGVGKSSVLDHLGDHFARAGLPFSLFDVDWFHRSWPSAGEDPDNVLTEAKNLRAVWQNYLETGPRTPIVAGVIESLEDARRYEEVFGRPLRLVHLVASPEVAEQRLRSRYDADRADTLVWHLANHRQLAAKLAQADWHTLTLDTDDLTPAQVAAAVFTTFPSRAE
ncbi:AAA family ATPase [Plantibacter sp. LMC-P-059a]|jgi:thymidylate kinase|uniref:AAA family ATPase n=1 Tax=Plantibacter sp. LMC-P-059a TaxID=3040297 RepID=UPI002550FC52|nr:AAA family ATPase [Plantibacter sp. LMC-P-059a]